MQAVEASAAIATAMSLVHAQAWIRFPGSRTREREMTGARELHHTTTLATHDYMDRATV
jgi:hypothetical protein